jgi:hypothetical protein
MSVVSSKTVAMVEMECTSKRRAEVLICLKPSQKPSSGNKRERESGCCSIYHVEALVS